MRVHKDIKKQNKTKVSTLPCHMASNLTRYFVGISNTCCFSEKKEEEKIERGVLFIFCRTQYCVGSVGRIASGKVVVIRQLQPSGIL